jgi:hypothetical protein
MYSIQALWTAPITASPSFTSILSNREYRIRTTWTRIASASAPSPTRPYPHMDLMPLELGFVDMARAWVWRPSG